MYKGLTKKQQRMMKKVDKEKSMRNAQKKAADKIIKKSCEKSRSSRGKSKKSCEKSKKSYEKSRRSHAKSRKVLKVNEHL
jgi:hypothetical protein